MSIFVLKVFMKTYISKIGSRDDSDVQKTYKFNKYPKDSKINSDKGFINIDNGEQGGTHWDYFILKNGKSIYFVIFGGAPDKFLLNQLPKPIIYHNYKIQRIFSRLCGSYFLVVFLFIRKNEILWCWFKKCILVK